MLSCTSFFLTLPHAHPGEIEGGGACRTRGQLMTDKVERRFHGEEKVGEGRVTDPRADGKRQYKESRS